MGNSVLLRLIVLTFLGLMAFQAPQPVIAQSKKAKAKTPKDEGQDAVVIVDGAAVYSVANFDAPVKEYLDRGKKYKVSKKIYPGIGGLGTFYKIRLRPGVFGFITDVDVEVNGKTSARNRKDEGGEVEGDPLTLQEDLQNGEIPDGEGGTLYLNRYLGLSAAFVSYAETLGSKKLTTSVPMLGLRRTGPTSYMGGMPLDLELLFTNQVPDFYSKIASESSGYLMIGSALAIFPMVDSTTKMIYYGFGPMARYSLFDVKLKNTPSLGVVDSQEIAIGATVTIGMAVSLGNWALRADARYNYEHEAYTSFSIAIQKN